MAKAREGAKKTVEAQEALDLFTVKRKQGKPAGQYESQSLKFGNASYRKRRKMAMDYVSPGGGGW